MSTPEPHTRPEVINAVISGYHSDPFSVLGPHPSNGGLVVCAFLPQAAAVELLPAGSPKALPMTGIHEAGFFEALVPRRKLPFDYTLRLTTHSGETLLYDDPYAFPSTLHDFDEYLLAEGTHLYMYEKLGAHLAELNGRRGVLFAVWAPNARRVSVVGNFNNWDGRRHPMRFHHDSGIWDLFIPNLGEGELYKYEIKTRYQDYTVAKSDPVGFYSEVRPNTASIVWDINKHIWNDAAWLAGRAHRHQLDQPINIYEVHLGSWRRKDDNEWLTYRELADNLVPYAKEMGYTHVELLPVAEHPYDGSWGYQVTGYFAPTSRYGTPEDFMAFVDACHQAGIGVILDWVPAHFPRDQHGLAFFDGTHLYEHADPRKGAHPDWGTLIFNYGRTEVRQFLVSNAVFWLDKYHIDGLRVDAVASMLYLDFSREAGQWVPNVFGGRENLEAIAFIRACNDRIHETFPDVLTIAEESTSWAGVTRPASEGGLGFSFKWNMGWMHDTLQYMGNDPIYRAYHHGTLTFSLLYAFSEHFLLPFSHDEVVHLKKSMLDKMPGDLWQKFANLRTLYAYQATHPGKKMLFMGGEFGQWREWSEERSLDWSLLDQFQQHRELHHFVRTVNHLYQSEPALHQVDYSWDGFTWIDLHDAQRSILSFARHSAGKAETILVACNFTPVVRHGYRLGVPEAGLYAELLNSDATEFGGSGVINGQPLASAPTPWHSQPHSIEMTLPPLAVVFLKKQAELPAAL
ncbi:MAG: 1,4-alpha-glucan branching protein GlgB [Chloroflexi bacterium]|nr:1,4-alpha-glucan branching protein GlgB [Chloroflexota bacterium]MCI0580213.1 1,4-alpha-glucan branching protein GlgB [Chloroflexota bacterium]MCI0646936.1 1,4-alpha-glucan branching protein GlgB [Chloroflexota bacterium]MCI0728691.1 1,4-alpha-glucan branching protein GlgB [Chloroflexota bacterium]